MMCSIPVLLTLSIALGVLLVFIAAVILWFCWSTEKKALQQYGTLEECNRSPAHRGFFKRFSSNPTLKSHFKFAEGAFPKPNITAESSQTMADELFDSLDFNGFHDSVLQIDTDGTAEDWKSCVSEASSHWAVGRRQSVCSMESVFSRSDSVYSV